MEQNNIDLLRRYASEYNDEKYFTGDPIIFPKKFKELALAGKASLKDVETAAVISAHLAWGRREMIIRDINRAMDEMDWKPYDYVMRGTYRNEDKSLHRTIKWSEFAVICGKLRDYYMENESLESLSPDEFRTRIYNQKSDPGCANKKIHMLRRWMVRDDGKVDLGLWHSIDKNDLIIPLDVHVHRSAQLLEITARKSADYKTAVEITGFLKEIFPGDPTLGDFALFAYAANEKKTIVPVQPGY